MRCAEAAAMAKPRLKQRQPATQHAKCNWGSIHTTDHGKDGKAGYSLVIDTFPNWAGP